MSYEEAEVTLQQNYGVDGLIWKSRKLQSGLHSQESLIIQKGGQLNDRRLHWQLLTGHQIMEKCCWWTSLMNIDFALTSSLDVRSESGEQLPAFFGVKRINFSTQPTMRMALTNELQLSTLMSGVECSLQLIIVTVKDYSRVAWDRAWLQRNSHTERECKQEAEPSGTGFSFCKKGGPCSHMIDSQRDSPGLPPDMILAGSWEPGQWNQQAGSVSVWILIILLHMKGFHLLCSLWIHWSTTWGSVQQ